MGKSSSLKVVHTVLEVVESLEHLGPVGVTELADYHDVPKSTIHAYLRSLEECGYVINDGGEYRLSLKLLERGGRLRESNELFRCARAEIDKLARETGEAVNLSVEEGGKRVILYSSEGADAVFNSPIGQYAHLHWTAMGKVMLSRMSDRRIDEIIDCHGLQAATSNTITDRDRLFEDIERTRERGYSIEREEHEHGIWAIGAPIVREDGSVVGAAAIVGPKSRFEADEVQTELAEALIETTNVIELKYQH